MEKMEVDNDIVVDLSVSHSTQPQYNNNTIRRSDYSSSLLLNYTDSHSRARRILRPRAEPRRLLEHSNSASNGVSCKPRTNGTVDSDSSEGEMPPLLPIKELSPTEVWQRERGLRRLREELRAEEMKLVLLKKLRQSQQLKENLATVPPVNPITVLPPPTNLPSGLSITPTTVKISSKTQQPQAAHTRHTSNNSSISISATNSSSKPTNLSHVPPLLRGQPPPARSSLHAPQLSNTTISATSIRGMAANLSVPQPPQRSSLNRSNFPNSVKDISPAVTITPAPPQSIKQQELSRPLREDTQTPAQRQAAAKSALRKQLEKTLLQIPPPKPPPPEMHFIPNPSNTEFIYLVGLEHVVDFLTKEPRPPAPPTPFQCQQCRADFTPVWKWEKHNKNRPQNNATFQQPTAHGKDPRVICEQCVTSNVKKSLKTEHTNRLKTAFVKALQQEQEIEQRLAQVSCNSPAPSPVATIETSPSPKSTPTPTPRHAATPPAPPPTQPTPPPSRQSHTSSHSTSSHTSGVGGGGSSAQSSSHAALSAAAVAHAASSHAAQQQSQQQSQQDKFHQSAAAMQAIQQQLFRAGLSPQHMLPFSPLFYPYMAIAQAAQAGNGGKNSANATAFAEMQRAADIQRQYLLDMIPPPSGQSRHNWKT